ncbi:EAL domain-containing protein [Lentibacillus cibarius]|uniref:EAL domain-containing protein n=1 Tax=Lentibacillus cibarius TaxID=2583219 RepID=A0A5S3QLL2_9BACI|nr:EAL domain-containing protein [Lentibacillus cibarius]TMN22669.1 EAL domain-containing protein [Lentibacillus cibarius]
MTLKEGLKVAITNEEFYIHYQPQFDLHSKNMVGLEALLRWHHPKLGSVSPAEFIPLAEETGSIVSIGKWVLRSACEQTNAWQRNGHPLLKIAVNVSAYQLTHPSFLEDLKQIIQETS